MKPKKFDNKKNKGNKGKGKKPRKVESDSDESGSDPDELTENEEDLLRQRRQEQEELEKALVEGMAGGGGDPDQMQSPDDVTILVTQEGGPGSKVQILIQLEETKSTLRVLGESFVTSMTESVKRKYSYIYIIALTAGLSFLGHITYITVTEGAPVSAESRAALLRLFVSVGMMIIISPMAFFIINLRIANICLGVWWMFMIVSLLYFTSTALSASAYYIHKFNRDNKEAGQNPLDTGVNWEAMVSVYEFVSTYYKNDYDLQEHPFIKKYSTLDKCCDYEFFHEVSDPKSLANVSIQTLWQGAYINETVTSVFKLPASCCVGGTRCDLSSLGTPPVKCDRAKLLKDIYSIMIFVLIYTSVMAILCITMALVFWYYYSDLKAREFSLQEQPGDFALLNLHRPHREGQTIELTIKEKLKRQRRKRKLSKLRQKYGMGEHHHHHHHHDGENQDEEHNQDEENAEHEHEEPENEEADDDDDDDDEGTSGYGSRKGKGSKKKKGKSKSKGGKNKKGKQSKKNRKHSSSTSSKSKKSKKSKKK
ncbi:unnamed protein product [Allacma fusca]|uniref:Uncharacterized protein n=1 Tax=Allacma fusca TaxID=39272 RepID=A0A8J2PVP9_9HEXA|nr:unnamed protein product [Allacma fusca]